jgi:selenocysteine lyase/cysteine desulfurase
MGLPASTVAVGATVSGLVGLVAASLPEGARVLVPEIEFTSTLFPFLVQADRGVRVRTVRAAELAEAIDVSTDVVVFSAVQMATGEVANLAAIAGAAKAHGALTLVDATQACGWLPLDGHAFDVVVVAGYKWLLAPRGTAYMAVTPERLADIAPTAAGWFAGEDVHATYFGGPLRLATDARRLDTSPAWHSWVGAAPALALLEEIGVEAIHEHDLALANRFRTGLGLEPGDSAIVFVDVPEAAARLERAGIRAAVRGGRVRTSWHLYNTAAEVDYALEALGEGL